MNKLPIALSLGACLAGSLAVAESGPQAPSPALSPDPSPALASTLPEVLSGRVHLLEGGFGTQVVLLEDHRAPLVFVELELAGGSRSPFIRQHPAAYEAFIRRAAAPDFARRAEELSINIKPILSAYQTILFADFMKEDRVPAMHLLRELLYDHNGVRPQKPRWQWNPGAAQAVQPPSQALIEKAYALFCPRAPDVKPPRRPPPSVSASEDPFRNRDEQLRMPGRIIGIAGDLSVAEATQLLTQLGLPAVERSGDAKRSANPPAASAARDPAVIETPCTKPSGAVREFPRPRITQVYFSYARIAPAKDPERSRLAIANLVFNRRLHDEFSQTGDTYMIDSHAIFRAGSGFYQIGSYSVTERARHFEDKLQNYVRHFGETGITAQELADALKTLRGVQLFSLREPAEILGTLMLELRIGQPIGQFYDSPSRYSRLTLEEVNDFIRRFYRPSDFVMIKLVPAPR